MSILPLAKKEIEVLKWVCIIALLVVIGDLTFYDRLVGSYFRGGYIRDMISYGTVNPILNPDLRLVLFLFFIVIVLAAVQFYGYNNTFIFSLPIKKNTIMKLKIMCGIASYSIAVLVYGLGLIYIFLKNRDWLEGIYNYFPMESYSRITANNSVGYILQYILLLWLALTAAYCLAVFFQVTLKNKIFACGVSMVTLWYPSFFYSLLNSGIVRWFNGQGGTDDFIAAEYKEYLNMAERIYMFSLPLFTEFTERVPKNEFVSYIGTIKEMQYSARVSYIAFYWPKILMALSIILLFTKLIFSCYESSYMGEERGMVVFPHMERIFFGLASVGAGLIFALYIFKWTQSFPVLFTIAPIASVVIYAAGILCMKRWKFGKGAKV